MRFAIIAEQRYLAQRMPRALLPCLRRAGHSVDIICSDDTLCDFRSHVIPSGTYDAVISRDRSLVGLFLLASAEKAGVTVVNPRAAVESVRNKAEMAASLAACDIPMPETVVCRSPHQLQDLPASFFPLVLKPNFGDNGNGVRLISADQVAALRNGDHSLVLAQKFVQNDGFDLKLYVAGERVWAVRKPNLWSAANGETEATAVAVDSEMRSLALRCGTALGLEVYGVDALPGPNGLQVLEVNEFPNFTGILEAPQVISDLLVMRARERRGEGAGRRPEKVA